MDAFFFCYAIYTTIHLNEWKKVVGIFFYKLRENSVDDSHTHTQIFTKSAD